MGWKLDLVAIRFRPAVQIAVDLNVPLRHYADACDTVNLRAVACPAGKRTGAMWGKSESPPRQRGGKPPLYRSKGHT